MIRPAGSEFAGVLEKCGDMLFHPRAMLRNLMLHWNAQPSPRQHIFVMGPPRSGTTLLQKILLQHSRIGGPDSETTFFFRRRLDRLAIDGIPEETLRRLFLHSRSKTALLDAIADIFLAGSGGMHFLEKSADHALKLDQILALYPNSHIVFIYRDGRDAFVSATRFRGIDPKIVARYPAIWRQCMRNLAARADHPNVLGVKYEDFCTEPETQLRRILAHLGLSLEQHLLDPAFYSRTPAAEDGNFCRLKEPIGARTIGIHRKADHADAVRRFERVAAAELRRFGYDPADGDGRSDRPRLSLNPGRAASAPRALP